MALLLLTIPLLGIIIEDFRFRAIHWYWLVLVAVFGYLHFGFHLHQTLINIIFLIAQIFLLSIYFSIKEKKWVNILDKYLGIGDVLFLVPIAFFLSPANLLFFIIASLVSSLLIVSLIRLCSANQFKTIPLAGLQSIFLMAWSWISWFNGYDFRWDSII